VSTKPWELHGDNQPLKPGYVRLFGVRLGDAPADWAGKVEVKVTDVEFAAAKSGA
jgi:hypothetical protein